MQLNSHPEKSSISATPPMDSSAAMEGSSAPGLDSSRIASHPQAVLVNIYDITVANALLWSVGCGVHHVGVQVYGKEYQYGRCDDGETGIAAVQPRHSPPHVFREQYSIGNTSLSAAAVEELVESMAAQDAWLGTSYHLIHHNCVDFARAFAAALLPAADRVRQHVCQHQMPLTVPPDAGGGAAGEQPKSVDATYDGVYTELVEVDGRSYSVPVLVPPHADRLRQYAVDYLPLAAQEYLERLDSGAGS